MWRADDAMVRRMTAALLRHVALEPEIGAWLAAGFRLRLDDSIDLERAPLTTFSTQLIEGL